MKTRTPIAILFAAAILGLLVACAAKTTVNGVSGYPSSYINALDKGGNSPQPLDPGTLSEQQAKALDTFEHVFAHIQAPDLASRVSDSYAKTFYFNDTFKTLHQCDALIDYLKATASKAKVRMTFINVVGSDKNFYLSWYMEMTYQTMGRTITRGSIGITQLRFNDAGKIVLHQDFWDGAEGFYQDLPFIGYWLKKIRGGM